MKLLKPLLLITVFILLSGCAVYTPDVAVVAPLGPVYAEPGPIIISPYYSYPYTYHTPYFHRFYAPPMYRPPMRGGPMRGGPHR
jgi:hypothetical protein